MPTTPVKFARAYDTSLTAKLVSVGGTGTPAASYACTNTNGLQAISVTEALVGAFYLYAYDADSEVAYQGYVLLADDTTTYFAVDDLPAALDAKKARQFQTNKRDLEVLGSTQWRYTVYEDDGTTPAYQTDYDPTTGEKEAV